MTRSRYVANLDRRTTEETLRSTFEQGGRDVKSVVIVTRTKRGRRPRSRGFAFIELGSDLEAEAAREALNGSALDGREITVRDARDRRMGDGGFHSGPGSGDRREGSRPRGGGGWRGRR